eukprot:scaffold133191_cov27-Prasinocladus_malaysianus.AAC.1
MVEHGVTADFVDNDVVVLVKDNPDTDEGWDAVNPQLHCLGQVATLSDKRFPMSRLTEWLTEWSNLPWVPSDRA